MRSKRWMRHRPCTARPESGSWSQGWDLSFCSFLMPGFFLSLFFTEGHHKFHHFSRTKETSPLILASSRGPRGGTCWWWPVHRHPLPFSSPSIYSSKISQFHRPQHRDAAGVLCDWHSFENHLLAVNTLCEVISILFVSLGYSSL